MKKQNMLVVLLACVMTAASGCATNQGGQLGADKDVFNKEQVIPLGAGLLSAVLCNKLFDGHGSKAGWTAVCGAAGYFGSIAFMKQHNQALEKNEVGQISSWQDPDGSTHSVTPTSTYYEGNTPCRDYRQTVEINGKTEIMSGKACRQRDGSWKLMS